MTAILVLAAGLTYRKSWRLKDFRTLKLGRLVLRSQFLGFIAFNCVILTVALFFPKGSDIFLWGAVVEVLLFFVFGPAFISIFIIVSIIVLTVKMWRRESKSVANLLLPLIMIIFFVLSVIYSWINGLPKAEWDWLRILATIYPVLAIYLTWQFMVFYVSSRAYGRRARKFTTKYKYYVVHGAGLVGGKKVGTLLANRIKAAVNAAGEDTVLVLSGGKGDDEHLSEAQAMQNYAVNELKFPIARTMLEDQSRTTYENLVNSAKMINDKFLIFTSDYHVFRTVLFAAQLKLDAQGGSGGKTAFYYRVPAFIREFIAVLNSQRKKHIIIVGCFIAFFVVLALLSLWFASKNPWNV
ncbi:YdcF family protein [Lactovum odontotermitis]